MQSLKHSDLICALRLAGLRPGNVAHVQSDLLRLGRVEGDLTRDAVGSFYLSALQEVLGPLGTVSVLTAFEDYGRFGTPFVREESPSRSGVFSEYLRTRPGSIRSIHPITSLTAFGHRAEEICGGPHFDGYGYHSPWRKLYETNALLISLGLLLDAGGVSFVHHIERLHGVPHQYTKLYDAPVHSNGQQLEGKFTMSVRYLDFGIADSSVRFKNELAERGIAKVVKFGGSGLWCARARDVFEAGMAALDRDPFAFLEKPPAFRHGEIPYDGNTGQMVHAIDRSQGVA